MTRSFPKFDAPPVVEMVLGVDFADLFGWEIPHFGLLWGQIREDYQNCSVQPPLVSQIETFGGKTRQELRFSLPIAGPQELRCWYSDRTETWLLQLQRNRFIHNWRKMATDGEYPRYHKVRQRFEQEWRRFQDFVKSEGLGELAVRQCEVTYFNHIEPKDDPEARLGLAEIFPCWSGSSSEGFLPNPDGVSINTNYVIPEKQGRLYISMQPAFRHADSKEIIQLTVSAKVITDSSDSAEIMKAFDLGHEWAVRGFTDFTSSEMHRLWERKQ